MPALFALTMFLSATLLFMVQPMVGKMVLPHVGGNPAVWNTCMVFFQALLLLGYWYAHKLTKLPSLAKQVAIHTAVLASAGAALLIAALLADDYSTVPIAKSLAPEGGALPFISVISMLALAIGLPFLAVSTSAPLLQRWFTVTGHPSAKDPYFLYAASNAGSLISLLGYPLFTEPTFRTVQQTWLWAVGFLLLIGFSIQCGRAALNPLRPVGKALPDTPVPEPTLGRKLRWLGRAFVPSSLMLGVTTHMTTDIASVPLLWVIPLALYLLTFIIAYARTPAWYKSILGNAAPVAVLLLIFIMSAKFEILSPFIMLAMHLFAYFLLALLMHTELANDRPDPKFLTNYFLWISFGGVLGGLFNAILAPLLFPQAFEYPIAIALGCMFVARGKPAPPAEGEPPREGQAVIGLFFDFLIPIAMIAVCAGLFSLGKAESFRTACGWIADAIKPITRGLGFTAIDSKTILLFAVFAPPCLLCFLFIERPLRFGLCVAAILFVPQYRDVSNGYDPKTQITRETIRSYFGIMRLEDYPQEWHTSAEHYFYPLRPLKSDGGEIDATTDKVLEFHIDTREMSHGTTLHGRQFKSRYKVPIPRTDPKKPSEYDGREYSVLPQFRDDIRALGVSSPWESIALLGAKEAWDQSGDPLTYYHRTGPVGALNREAFARKGLPKVGMVGLGTGSGAAYAIRGQSMTFYEIDPAVKDMIEDGKHFTYVTDARRRGADVDIVMGDARLMLEKHKGPQYDLLLIDAFSSDSIPVHLLTVESVKLYRERLAPKGLLALHVSNRYLRLEPIVAAIAEKNGMVCRIWADADNPAPGKTESSWIVLADSEADLGPAFVQSPNSSFEIPWKVNPTNPEIPAWTDDYQDILRIIRSKELQSVRRRLGLPTPVTE